MSTGIITGTGTTGLRRPDTQDRTPSQARTGTAGTRGRSGSGTGTRRRHLVPPRTGSRQQISVRGRRVAETRTRQGSAYLKLVIALVLLTGLGVAATMFLSAKSTEQAYVLQDARERSATLDHELESLNRDYRELSSSEHLASEASRLGMVVPGQAGVLDVQGDQVNETRPADNTSDDAVVDLDSTNQGVARTDRPTSDPSQNSAQQAPAAPAASDSAANPESGQAGAPAAGGATPQTGQLPY